MNKKLIDFMCTIGKNKTEKKTFAFHPDFIEGFKKAAKEENLGLTGYFEKLVTNDLIKKGILK